MNRTEKALARLATDYDKRLDLILTDVHARYVVPTCVRRGWTFVAGMGDWSFYDKTGEPIDSDRLPKRVAAALGAETMYRANDVGSLLRDYRHG